MTHEYVFRGEGEPFAPDPKAERAREQAKREAEKLVTEEPVAAGEAPANLDEVERRLDDYQVGGLDVFGATADNPPWEDAAVTHEQPQPPRSDDHPPRPASQ